MPSLIRRVAVWGTLGLGLAGQLTAEGQGGVSAPPPPRQEPQRSIEIDYLPVFFREDKGMIRASPTSIVRGSRSIQSCKGTS